MQTLRSFLAMAALAPLARPLARAAARTGQPCRALAGFLPNTQIQALAGRDLVFYPDLVPGRLVVVDLLYARRAGILAPTGAAAPAGNADPDLFLYALTEQPAPSLQSDLRRAMRIHARERVGAFAQDGAAEVDVLRTRLVLLDEAPRPASLVQAGLRT
jgi:hypothetical protein